MNYNSLLLQCDVINLSESIQPLELGKQRLEGATPVGGILKLVLHSVLRLSIQAILPVHSV